MLTGKQIHFVWYPSALVTKPFKVLKKIIFSVAKFNKGRPAPVARGDLSSGVLRDSVCEEAEDILALRALMSMVLWSECLCSPDNRCQNH